MRHAFTLFLLSALPVVAQAQSQRLVLLEHFTQASCGPCATYNPAINAIINANPGMIVSVKYQTSWPGVDPMNAHNPTEVANRVNYYGINGVPHGVIDGNYVSTNPANIGFGTFANRAAVPSPLTVKVTQSFSAAYDSIRVRAVITKTGNTPANANLRLHMAVVERNIYFATPPGSNGERHFESVMKKMLPNASGTAIGAMNIGDSVVVNESWKLANVYNMEELASVAFVQNLVNREVLQAGYAAPNFPLAQQLIPANGLAAKIAGNSSTSTFDLDFSTSNPNPDVYRLTLNKSLLPTGWDASFTVNGNTYTDFADINLGAMDSAKVQVNIQSGNEMNQRGVVTLKSNSTTTLANVYSKTLRLTAFSKINTAFINKKPAVAGSFAQAFNAANSSLLIISPDEFNTLDPTTVTDANINQLFYNTSDLVSNDLIPDAEIASLTNYLNSGGQIFISGQDIAYSALGLGGSQAFQDFVSNYLGAVFINTGNNTNHQLSVPATDGLFNNLGTTSLSSLSTSSDHLMANPAQTNAREMLVYDSVATDGAAIRNHSGNWKTVYLGFRLEAAATAFRNQLVDFAIKWFNGDAISSAPDAQLANLNLKVYPNPADKQLMVDLTDINDVSVLTIYDMMGREVLSRQVPAGSNRTTIDISSVPSGAYFYRLTGGVNTSARSLVVMH